MKFLNLKHTIYVIIFISSFYLGYTICETKWKKEVLNDYITKQEANQKVQEGINKISKEYQEKLQEIEGSTDRVIHDLNVTNRRLWVKVKNSARQQQDYYRCVLNGKAELDPEFSRRLIRITQKGDLWIETLQGTIKQMQQEPKNKK